jgi:hypothetical protein
VNEEFVPVWINVRTTPVPDIACMEDVLGKVAVDADGVVQGSFSQGFFLRSVVLAQQRGDAPQSAGDPQGLAGRSLHRRLLSPTRR